MQKHSEAFRFQTVTLAGELCTSVWASSFYGKAVSERGTTWSMNARLCSSSRFITDFPVSMNPDGKAACENLPGIDRVRLIVRPVLDESLDGLLRGTTLSRGTAWFHWEVDRLIYSFFDVYTVSSERIDIRYITRKFVWNVHVCL